ncbi:MULTISPECIES: adhesin [Metabacillus]|jgi:iron-sulfur cluster assembly protein|uniref:Adhesin n=1 Tax=Metabacillus rhizolycopersici TaxID=2875709 RepID=A0ABS7UXP4_9BACI|nr:MULTISPECIES: adhesin [Metabacillus]MBZ5753075.1 adhesin [Metabacillus rhizolycopersici]MCM3654474.1 adhesin [Metabacillus litoralis]
MKITDGAKQLLENFLNEKGAEGIRLSSVAGCCGPQFTISLDAPQETDTVKTINGIRVAIDSQITGTDELTLDKEESQEGAGLVLLGASSCC